jgi:hypothetical protein
MDAPAPMLGDRRLPFAVAFDQPRIRPQLRRAAVNHFLEELEGLLLREAIEEPDKGDPVGKAKGGCECARHLPSWTKSSSVRMAARLSWSRENITAVIPQTPRHRRSSLAYKITRICLIPYIPRLSSNPNGRRRKRDWLIVQRVANFGQRETLDLAREWGSVLPWSGATLSRSDLAGPRRCHGKKRRAFLRAHESGEINKRAPYRF